MVPFFRTLRFKIAGAFLLWTMIFQLTVAVIIPVAREGYVMREVDVELLARSETAARRLAQGEKPGDLVASEDLADAVDLIGPSSLVLYRVRTPDGRTLAASGDFDTEQLPILSAPATPASPAGVHFETVSAGGAADAPGERAAHGGRLRIATVGVASPQHGPLILDVAYSLRNADWLQGVMRWLLILALLPGALGAGLAGWLIARSIASRVEGVGRELRAVSASRLGERVQLPGGNDEIGQMAADINAMLDRLASTFRGMEQFMSEVSHELKTPVAALLAEAQVMKYSEPSADTSKQFISSVEEEMRRLGKLVESFLMLARFEHGRRFLAEGVVPVNDVVLESVEHSSRMASQAAVTLSLQLYDPGQNSPEALVRGDAELLRIVFDNLIRNAVQFSDRNSTVSVFVGMEDRTVTIDVRDRGPGAPPDYINKIFERFTQAPTQKPGRRGTGLGLAIAKGVVELHSGTIHARNHPEGGCVFTVRLPLLLRPGVEPAPMARAAAASMR